MQMHLIMEHYKREGRLNLQWQSPIRAIIDPNGYNKESNCGSNMECPGRDEDTMDCPEGGARREGRKPLGKYWWKRNGETSGNVRLEAANVMTNLLGFGITNNRSIMGGGDGTGEGAGGFVFNDDDSCSSLLSFGEQRRNEVRKYF
jgi:hypothetical protein